MAVISEVKCGRCDRRYSGFRGRCPYCGARRNKRGKHADDTDNAKAKLIIGILLLVMLIAATMVLILTSIPKNNGEVSSPTDSADVSAAEPSISTGVDVTNIQDTTEPSPSEEPSPSNAPVKIAEVIVIWKGDGQPRKDITIAKVGDTYKMGYTTIPETTTDKVVKWETSDPTIFMVTTDGTVKAIGKGSATLTCTIDGAVGKCIIRVKGA